jgi:hypothetical protein
MPGSRSGSYRHTSKILSRSLDIRSISARNRPSRLRFMPMEGHWARLNTPVRETTSREKLLVRVALALLAAAAVATVIVALVTSNSDGPAAGCVRVDLPSTMGGGTPELCGATAREFCSSRAANSEPLDHTALPKCREAGIPTGSQ